MDRVCGKNEKIISGRKITMEDQIKRWVNHEKRAFSRKVKMETQISWWGKAENEGRIHHTLHKI